jgi:DNA-binding NtrC family response regulator
LRSSSEYRVLHLSYFTSSSLDEVEREFIRRTIAFADGNKARASEMLGVPRRTLYGKLERYGASAKIERPI